MLNNRKTVNYAIYENIGGTNTGNWNKTEYCVLCHKNGKMGLWGQINVDDYGDAYPIRIRYPKGCLYYKCCENFDMKLYKLHPEMEIIQTITFMNWIDKDVGQLSFVKLKEGEERIMILESGLRQVLVQKLLGKEGFYLKFYNDGTYDDKESLWYFRRFDEPLMAAMIYNEQANMSNKFKERYGVTLPGDISDELVAMLLSIPFLN